jgi:serine/threonine protein kinase
MIGRNLGNYRILARFDLGESGSLYKAVHTTQRQTLLLKILRGQLDRAIPLHHQFVEDIQMTTYLDHPQIVRTMPLEFYEEFIVIPMEFVYGQELSGKIAAGKSTVESVHKIALQAAEALRTAHQVGLIHGRMTSNNLLLTHEGDLKIFEFGFASLPEDLLFQDDEDPPHVNLPIAPRCPPLSRYAYLAPEQVCGYRPEGPSDLFALGVILYEMLAGEFLFLGTGVEELYQQIRQRELPQVEQIRPGVSRGLGRVISSLLEKDPAKRYPSAESLLEDLRRIRTGDSIDRLSFQPKDPALSRRSFFRRFVGDHDR